MWQVLYREGVGALMWAVTMTRPEISYAAHQITKFNKNPGPAHRKATNDMELANGK